MKMQEESKRQLKLAVKAAAESVEDTTRGTEPLAHALGKARGEVLATLKAVLDQKMRDPEDVMCEVNEALFDYLYGYGDDHVSYEELLNGFHLLNFYGADDFDDNQLKAFGAALEFLKEINKRITRSEYDNAAKIISKGNYTYYPQAYDEDTLGIAIYDERTDVHDAWLDEYIDYERIGEDVMCDTGGTITSYGFFALG